jgi:hypothetical protein
MIVYLSWAKARDVDSGLRIVVPIAAGFIEVESPGISVLRITENHIAGGEHGRGPRSEALLDAEHCRVL